MDHNDLLTDGTKSHSIGQGWGQFHFYTPVLYGTYYDMALSVRPSVRPVVST